MKRELERLLANLKGNNPDRIFEFTWTGDGGWIDLVEGDKRFMCYSSVITDPMTIVRADFIREA